MIKKKNSKIILGVLIAVITLGIGYASISGINLLINGNASLKANGEFKVRFVRPDSNETAIDNPVQNAITISGHNADGGVMDVSEMSASITDDTNATFAVGALDEIGEYVDFTYTVVNESDDKDALLSFEVADENELSNYFEITKSIAKNQITINETTTVTVRVKLIGQPKISDAEATFKVTLTATPVDESAEPSTPSEPTPSVYQIGDSINYNPVDNTTCENPTSAAGTKTGCMKWYVITTDDTTSKDTIDVILDHNTTAMLAYDTSETYKEYANASIKTQVDIDTAGWASGLNPRLITADELASITNTTTFNGSTNTWFYFDGTGTNKQTQASSGQGTSPYAWLFDYTYGCTSYGCNTTALGNYGYWTSSPVSNYSNGAWSVGLKGRLEVLDVDFSDPGVRPVITIDKSVLN